MPKPALYRSPLESATSIGESTRHSLYDSKDAFIERISPVATAAIYFGSFSLATSDPSLARQALFKLSFLHRHFLQHAGLQIAVEQKTAILSGPVTSRLLVGMAGILARQIEGITLVKDETEGGKARAGARSASRVRDDETIREAIQLLFATDQTLHSGVQVAAVDGHLVLEGEVRSAAQQSWAEQLAEAAGGKVLSQLKTNATPPSMAKASEPTKIDDESLQALILFRLRLVSETEHLAVKVKAVRGIVALQGKVRTEALRQRVENIARSTLGVRELRSSLTLAK